MPERPLRLECPVCPGVRLAATRIAEKSRPEIDHCARCGGVWFEQGEIQQMRRHRRASVAACIPFTRGRFRMACRGCSARMHRWEPSCEACGWANVLDCPVCARPMERHHETGHALDVCHACRGVWFDGHELGLIWRAQAAVILANHPATAQLTGEPAGNTALDVLSAGDAVEAAYYATRAGVEVASSIPEASSQAFEVAVAVGEIAGQASSAVFDVVCGILELIFGGLSGL